jgi:hypothetical protein
VAILYRSVEKLALLAPSLLGMDWLSSCVPFPAELGSLFARANQCVDQSATYVLTEPMRH